MRLTRDQQEKLEFHNTLGGIMVATSTGGSITGKGGKTRRQIILITHNPNLVVNGDSEQIIVARCDRRANGLPYITYQSGSLENDVPADTGIKQQVCQILEGGSDAFQRRERRYALARN